MDTFTLIFVSVLCTIAFLVTLSVSLDFRARKRQRRQQFRRDSPARRKR